MRRCIWPGPIFTALIFCIFLFNGVGVGSGQTYDFGYVPLGTTNNESGFYWYGGSWNGVELVMTSETVVGSNAVDFATSPNYTGQTLD